LSGLRVSLFIGDIAAAVADALCTSTNPRLSLMMGTGASVRGGGGYEILRECERIVASAGGPLPAGAVYVTTAGTLPAKIVIHCVASGSDHKSSEDIVRRCVSGALEAVAAAGCASVAMPLFGAGHARLPFSRSLAAILGALRANSTPVQEVMIVVQEREREEEARRMIEKEFGSVAVTRSAVEPESSGGWFDDDD
jgi:O-acetyl-ADP-ribose deacetylase (regulator of RNase III)